MKRTVTAFLLSCLALATAVRSARAATDQVPMVQLHLSSEMGAPPAAIWAYLVKGRNLVSYCPMWKSAKNASVNLVKVGDVLEFTDEWGNGGRSIVTYLVPNRELRVVHEPNKGDYVCQAKITLAPSGPGTMVQYWEQYSDASAAADLEATAAKTKAGMAQMLAAIKKSVERP